jgi:Flp pilus assembly pilin Flp
MLAHIRSLARATHGASMVDYSLIAAIIAVAGISAMRAIGVKASGVMNTIAVTLS